MQHASEGGRPLPLWLKQAISDHDGEDGDEYGDEGNEGEDGGNEGDEGTDDGDNAGDDADDWDGGDDG